MQERTHRGLHQSAKVLKLSKEWECWTADAQKESERWEQKVENLTSFHLVLRESVCMFYSSFKSLPCCCFFACPVSLEHFRDFSLELWMRAMLNIYEKLSRRKMSWDGKKWWTERNERIALRLKLHGSVNGFIYQRFSVNLQVNFPVESCLFSIMTDAKLSFGNSAWQLNWTTGKYVFNFCLPVFWVIVNYVFSTLYIIFSNCLCVNWIQKILPVFFRSWRFLEFF